MSLVAKVFRGPIVDLTHAGHIAVVDSNNNLLYSYGDPERITYIRSSAKPIQALTALLSGAVDAYDLTQKELALLCASHNGESIHTQTVLDILQKAGLDASYLQCGTHASLNPSVAQDLQNKGVTLGAQNNNCSGKHSGMLLQAKYMGEDLSTYLQKEHPLQQRILKNIASVCGIKAESIIIGTDGCGVPVHALPLRDFAYGMARLANPQSLDNAMQKAATRVVDAMIEHPYMVAGKDRLCTDLMATCKGKVFAKLGADGYYAIGVPSKGVGITCKCEDGKIAIVEAMAVHVLRKLGILDDAEFEALSAYHNMQVKNHRGEIVGHTQIEFEMKEY